MLTQRVRRAVCWTHQSSHPKNLCPVVFELLIFRPIEDSVLCGTIKACNEQGIQVSMVFYDDIFIPAGMMLPGTVLYVSPVKLA
jgi:DNA-directed RNA polymerase subunit E'/Rpb7